MKKARSSADISIETFVLNDDSDWSSITPEWRKFLESGTADYQFWGNPEVLKSDIVSKPGSSVLIAWIRISNATVALVPFEISLRRKDLKIGLIVVGSVNLEVARAYTDNFPILSGLKRESIFHSVIKEIRTHHLCDIITAAEWPVFTPDLSNALGYQQRNIQKAYSIELPDSFEEFLSQKSSNTRQTLRYDIKKIKKSFDGAVEVKCFEMPDQVERLLIDGKAILLNSWHSRLKTFSFPSAGLLDVAAANGWLRSYILYIKKIPVAIALGYQSEKLFLFESTAYDENYAAHGPGKVLCTMFIEDLILRNRPKFADFGFGENKYKDMLCNIIAQECEFNIPIRWKGRFYLFAVRVLDAVYLNSKRLAGNSRIVPAIKNYLRNRTR